MVGLVLLYFTYLGIPKVLGAIVNNVTVMQNTWLSNALGQSPCLVFAELMGQCFSGDFAITPDGTGGLMFIIPGSGNLDIPCYCSTVQYYLLSACYSCAGHRSSTWAQYIQECDTVTPVIGRTGYPILPSGVLIPSYAMIQSTQDFDLMLADQIGLDGLPDTDGTSTVPVFVSGTAIGAIVNAAGGGGYSTSWVTTQTIIASTPTRGTSSRTTSGTMNTGPGLVVPSNTGSSQQSTSRPSSASSTSSSQAAPSSAVDTAASSSMSGARLGAIIGGAVGGCICLLALIATVILLCRRRNRQSQYRVSLTSARGGVFSPPPPSPAPWFPPMPTPAPSSMAEIDVHAANSHSTLYHLGPEAVPYASPIRSSEPISGHAHTEWDEKRTTLVDEERSGEKWVPSAYGYCCPEKWGPLPLYHGSQSSVSSSASGEKR
ncbi:hypothetical protein DACRYDRAFT_115220 [Dacryopinax primogenitus]|uniref:Uncharacterized protein n=1 Tax=Dacryopinax primogenitus (strain DJM 731) TaxID=1858805 RepID=M5G6U3_DACPD|nr:uncharacterized protein DACRYDRAFT_115220 [Dacryopinax primogenitus]EJU03930.1 hypothetical protein DACRYDRAFT_115220 [Dacryopinax primogenitus]